MWRAGRFAEATATLEDDAMTSEIAYEPPGSDEALRQHLLFMDRTGASFPVSIEHLGETYNRTEKPCRNMANGEAWAEYQSIRHRGLRVWLTASGRVIPD